METQDCGTLTNQGLECIISVEIMIFVIFKLIRGVRLVSISRNVFSYLEMRQQDIDQNPEDYCRDEKSDPISIGELKYGT